MSAYRHRNFNSVNRYMAVGAFIGIIIGIIAGIFFGYPAFSIAAGLALGICGGAVIEGMTYKPPHNKEG